MQQPPGAEYLFQSPGNGVQGFSSEHNGLNPDMFEAMSTLQPLSAWVGTIPDYSQ